MTVEIRDHLGPHEVEIDTPLYGIMLIGVNRIPVMSLKLFSDKEKAIAHADKTFTTAQAYVVRINSTNA